MKFVDEPKFMTIDQEFLGALRVGDTVTRMLAGVVPMQLRITAMDDSLITCGAWTFNRSTGGEVDADLGWDGVCHTGSFLTPNE
jgi:hypothetical protein